MARTPSSAFKSMSNMSLKQKYKYRRRLPHLQADNKPIFVTFRTFGRWILPSAARDIIFDCCRKEPRIRPFALVVMPDHVHVIFAPTRDAAGHNYALPEIMQSLKSSSAHKINKLLGRRGPVWDEEFFDHAIRSPEALAGKIEYVLFNPVQNRLAARPSEYRWAWAEIAFADEGVRATP